MVKFSNYLKQKGQGIVEYALLLAFIVGIAVALQGVGLKDAVVGVFDNVATVLAGGKESQYASALTKWGNMSTADLHAADPNERLAADKEGLANAAEFFLGKEIENLANYGFSFNDNDLNKLKRGEAIVALNYWPDDSTDSLSSYTKSGEKMLELMQGSSIDSGTYVGTHGNLHYSGEGVYSNQRYFFSEPMIEKSNKQRQLKVQLLSEENSEGKHVITSAKVWASQHQNNDNDPNNPYKDLSVTISK